MKGLVVFIVLVFGIVSCEKNETLFSAVSSKHSGITFNNRIVETDSSNILTNEYIFNGGGIAIGDFNNDGKNDILFTGNQVPNTLYLNLGGLKFKDVSEASGIRADNKWHTGTAIIDINLDGWLDVYVCAAMNTSDQKRKNSLFVNQGVDGNGVPVFKEMAAVYGIDDDSNSMNATFFDYDKDGLLDLYVLNNEQTHTLPTNYRPKLNDGSAVSNDRLYRNNGDGTFSDVTIEAGIVYEGFGLGLSVADLNYDGWPDIHVCNDYLTNDILYINNGNGTFTNEIDTYLKHQSKFSMGSDIADYDNDGFLDIITLDMLGETNHRMKTTIGSTNYLEYILNERYDYQYQYMRNMLHKGNGVGGNYSEIGLLAGISKTDWSWAPLFMDADNDGFRDLLITNGFPRDITDKDFGDFGVKASPYLSPARILDSIPVVKLPNYAYRNKGDLTFEDSGESWGLNISSFSNGAAYADLDMDGDLDYVVNNINDEAFLFENNSGDTRPANHYLRIELRGPSGNPMGVGSKIVLRQNDEQFQYHEQYLTRGYMSSIEPTVHFGLGQASTIESLEILWPDGNYQKIGDLSPDGTIIVEYSNARPIGRKALTFPLVPESSERIFFEVSDKLGVEFVHEERDYIDYNVQRIIPHKFTQNGPCLVVGDLDGDSIEDFIVGSSANFAPLMFLQDSAGSFIQKPLFDENDELKFEEEGMELFDIDNDGDLDLYLVSGSNEFGFESEFYTDRLYINDGAGNFTYAPDRIPYINASGSVVKAEDFDADGYIDLFVGGRTPFGQYPMAERSFLLKNNAGTLVDVTEQLAPDLQNIGMVTDASWVDLDKDNYSDLVLVGELMPVVIFKNNGSGLTRLSNSGIDDYFGWWESIVTEDMDGDGDIDIIAGNIGQNNLFQPSLTRPLTVKAKDFDENGSLDPLSFAYFKSSAGEYTSYPVHFWSDINNQNRMFRSKFNYFKEYAQATESTLLNNEELNGALELKGNYDQSSYIENLGNGSFKLHALPVDAQFAPVNDITTGDINNDGAQDILGIGNDFGNEIFVGRYDALNGVVLNGDGKGGFTAIPSYKSGFIVPGDAKSIDKVKNALGGYYYVVTQNKGKLLIFRQ